MDTNSIKSAKLENSEQTKASCHDEDFQYSFSYLLSVLLFPAWHLEDSPLCTPSAGSLAFWLQLGLASGRTAGDQRVW